jgi:thioredoxin reductase (NADPH)
MMREVIIIGGGPAGYAAGIYCARAQLAPLLFTGKDLGGQIALTEEIENYPGFADPVGGFELSDQMRRQAERFGTEMIQDVVTGVRLTEQPFEVTAGNGQVHQAKSVIVATGASYRRLGVPGEERLVGHGVSYCATCDGFFFRDQKVLVVGGGNAALDEAIYLSRIVKEIRIVHRRDELRGDKILQDRAMATGKIGVIWDSVVVEIVGEEHVTGARLKNVKTGEESNVEASGIFIFIGYIPNTGLFKGQLEMDEGGHLIVDEHQATSIPGVFAAGDVHDWRYRQVATASGYGVMAAAEVQRYLSEA